MLFYDLYHTSIDMYRIVGNDMVSDMDSKLFFSSGLLEWFLQNQRSLPWRMNKDPYRIWVSEIMLQQTRVDTVIPYYHRFMEKYPSIDALADAPEEEVLKAWEGLGYYSRARNLQAAVREVKELYAGVVPDEPEEIAMLRGVGPYTAGAILSIAYNKPEPAVDGNVMRVLSRFFLIEEDVLKPATRKVMEALVRELIPEGTAGDFNQALMELGALVCTPKSPYCLTCPVMERCEGRIAGKELELPIKKKAKPPRNEYRAVALVEGTGENRGKILIRQRPESGLLARMWELPHVLLPENLGEGLNDKLVLDMKDTPRSQLLQQQLFMEGNQSSVYFVEPFIDVEHVFSHIHWHMRVYRFSETGGVSLQMNEGSEGSSEIFHWLAEEERASFAFPNVFIRIMDEYWR
jgi:A/G-specific adenine glycosylase